MKEVEQNHGSYRQLLFDKRWHEKRAQIIQRDNYRCAICAYSENLTIFNNIILFHS